MKIRFWQKTYFLTLGIFLLCLNVGILSLTVYTHQKSISNTEAAVSAEQYYVATSFQRDWEDMLENNPDASVPLLMQAYGGHYCGKGVYLAFWEGETTLFTNFPTDVPRQSDTLRHIHILGNRHILISASLCEGKYDMVFAKNVESLDDEFRTLRVIFGCTAMGISAVLAAVLYFVLRRLSAPLEQLRKTTECIEAGDFTAQVPETGNDEFTAVAKSFNLMLAKIREQMASLESDAQKKQMLVDNLAHELRTPLTSIHGYAEFLEKAAAGPQQRMIAAQYILSESERLQKISEILLDSAYIRGSTPEMTAVSLTEVLSDVSEKLQSKASASEVTLRREGESVPVRGNETLLSMLVYNLAENAIKACSPGGAVVLRCEDAAVTVSDNGKGMTAQQLAHITEPFYRTDKSRSRAEGGAGLGLALCDQIVKNHGTALSFRSEPEKGTQVCVKFTIWQSGSDMPEITS